ncbi:MAG TPA: hypothetical protein VGF99_05375 [Myxococcota bacterium]
MGLKTVLDLRERQREEAALAMAVQRRQRDDQATALERAIAQRDSIPTSALNADDLDLLDRAARAAERSIVTAKEALSSAEALLIARVDDHKLRSMQHQAVTRISERRADDKAADDRRKEQRTADDLAARRISPWS